MQWVQNKMRKIIIVFMTLYLNKTIGRNVWFECVTRYLRRRRKTRWAVRYLLVSLHVVIGLFQVISMQVFTCAMQNESLSFRSIYTFVEIGCPLIFLTPIFQGMFVVYSRGLQLSSIRLVAPPFISGSCNPCVVWMVCLPFLKKTPLVAVYLSLFNFDWIGLKCSLLKKSLVYWKVGILIY